VRTNLSPATILPLPLHLPLTRANEMTLFYTAPRRQASQRSSSWWTASFSAGAHTSPTPRTRLSPEAWACKSARQTPSSCNGGFAPRSRSTWSPSARAEQRATNRHTRRSHLASGGCTRPIRTSSARGRTSLTCARIGRPHRVQRDPVGPGSPRHDWRAHARHRRFKTMNVLARTRAVDSVADVSGSLYLSFLWQAVDR